MIKIVYILQLHYDHLTGLSHDLQPYTAMIQKCVTQILRCVAPNIVMQRRLTTICTPIIGTEESTAGEGENWTRGEYTYQQFSNYPASRIRYFQILDSFSLGFAVCV